MRMIPFWFARRGGSRRPDRSQQPFVRRFSVEPLESRSLLSAAPLLTRDINVGAGSSTPNHFAALGNLVIFEACDAAHGVYDLWKSDGTSGGTTLLSSAARSPGLFTAYQGELYFAAYDTAISGIDLWKTDGTSAGTKVVSDQAINPSEMTVMNGSLYFGASLRGNGINGFIWKTDGTSGGTTRVSTTVVNPMNLTVVGGNLFFVNNADGSALWKTNGTGAGTARVRTFLGETPRDLTNSGGVLYFTASDFNAGYFLWKSDGTSAGTSLVSDVPYDPGYLLDYNGTLFFAAYDSASGFKDLWKSSGTSATTTVVSSEVDLSGVGGTNLSKVGNTVYFGAQDTNDYYYYLWKTDGVVTQHVSMAPSVPESLAAVAVGSTTYFIGGDASNVADTNKYLWQTDGFDGGTFRVSSAVAAVDNSYLPGTATDLYVNRPLVNVNGTLFFDGYTSGLGNELWSLHTPPSVTINQAAGQSDPVGTSPVVFDVKFSTPVTGFSAAGVTLGGTALGTLQATVAGSGANYTVSVTGMTTSGTITAAIKASAAHDALGGFNTASTSSDNTVTYYYLRQSGTTLTVVGTTEADSLMVNLPDATHVGITLNGFTKTYSIPTVSVVTVNTGGGADQATINEFVGGANMAARPTTASLQRDVFHIDLNGFNQLRFVDKSGGNDYANFIDPKGGSTFAGQTAYSYMQGTGYSVRADGFKTVYAVDQSGKDGAYLVDSTGTASLGARPTYAYLQSGVHIVRATGFAVINATDSSGHHDTAYFVDDTGTVTFGAQPNYAYFQSATSLVKATGFAKIYATDNSGRHDTAYLADPTGTAIFGGLSTYAYLQSTTSFVKVMGFALVVGTDQSKLGTAYFVDSTGNATLTVSATSTVMGGTGYTVRATGFKYLRASGIVGGNNAAVLSDSSGNDFLRAPATNQALFVYAGGVQVRLTNFKTVTANHSLGADTYDKSETDAVGYTLILQPPGGWTAV
jgi:ELWxxDGT repeat protein